MIKQFDIDNIKIPFRIVVSSKSNSGKSHYVNYLLYSNSEKFEKCYVISYTNDDYYEYITKHTYKEYSEDIINKIINNQEKEGKTYYTETPRGIKKKKEYKHVVLILDDCIGNVNLSHEKSIDRLYASGRHYNISIIIITQKYKAVSNLIRNNLNYLILFSHSNKEQKKIIASEYSKYDKDIEFYRVLDTYTKNYGCLIIDNNSSSLKYYYDRAPKIVPTYDFPD